ncbi:MAG: RtcB family protein [Candidatus Anstonellales archaeon]
MNCLLPSTRILSPLGYHKRIYEFKESFSEIYEKNGVVLLEGNTEVLTGWKEGKATYFMHKNYNGKIYKIKTLAGTVRVTPDHPILTTKRRMMPHELKEGDGVLVYPFDGVGYKYFKNEEELAIYAKLIGYLTGDGTITRCGEKLRAIFFGKKTDLERMKRDVEKLGYHAHLVERTRKHTIKNRTFVSKTAELHVYSKKFVEKLIELGGPVGNKTEVEFRVPEWIRKAPLWIKRLYLAGFFGAELSSPSTSSKTGFYIPTINMNKIKTLEKNGRQFFLDITELLEEFDVKVSKITVIERMGEKIRLRLEIDGKEKNIKKLYRRIGFEYNEKRMVSAMAAVLYIELKSIYRKKRDEIRKKVREYKKKGFSLRELQERFSSKWANPRFIERAYYENKKPRAPLFILSFKEFLKEQLKYYWIFGALVSPVIEIDEEYYKGEVYDFTVEEIHRFVANGIVVSNCGVRLLLTNMEQKNVKPKIREIVHALFTNVPSGVGSEGKVRLRDEELKEVLTHGVDWAIENNYGWKEDKESIEEYGRMEGADPLKISPTAMKRGKPQLGTLGAGNHFLEIQHVEKIHLPKVAKAFGLYEGQVVVMIHTGSRGFGHQVASDYINVVMGWARKNGIRLADPELAYAPVNSKEGEDYIKAMKCAVNFAFTNRQMIMHWVRESFAKVYGSNVAESMKLVYDVAHNIAKFEEHEVDGKRMNLIVHRKGATRAFPAGRKELPKKYIDIGQPVIIPGSMGTASYVLVGNQKGLEVSFGSTCHGAGRVMSRHEAIRRHRGEQIVRELGERGITVKPATWKVAAEEAPDAYKDIDDVVNAVQLAGISNIVAKLRPIAVVKG